MPEINSLQLSIQVNTPYLSSDGWDDIPPELPWHCSPNTWISLRDSLTEMDNLRHLSVWLDSSSRTGRQYLMFDWFCVFGFDPRLEPILRVSKPVNDFWSDYYPRHNITPYVVKRGMSELWQEPTIEPHITFSERHEAPGLYQVARHGGPVGPFPLGRRTLRQVLSESLGFSRLKSMVLPQ